MARWLAGVTSQAASISVFSIYLSDPTKVDYGKEWPVLTLIVARERRYSHTDIQSGDLTSGLPLK